MFAKFAIGYVAFPHHPHERSCTYFTDDPVEAQDFLMHLLAARARHVAIRHDRAPLAPAAFNRMLKIAAERPASALLRASLALNAGEMKNRFGLAA